jgi:uncharacterized membrane protein
VSGRALHSRRSEQREIPMSELMVLTFPNQTKIDEACGILRRLHFGRSKALCASAIVTKNADGNVSVQRVTKGGHGGSAVAALIGALAGLPAGPAAAIIMATGGAVLGAAVDISAEDV